MIEEAGGDLLGRAQDWQERGADVALATVVQTWGSAPRPVGSSLIIDGKGNFLGSVSGGCVEGAVVGEAQDVLATGKPRLLEFGVADETAWRVGLSCGGRISVYVERIGDSLSAEDLSAINRARAERRAVVRVTRLDDGSGRTVFGKPASDDPLTREISEQIHKGKSALIETPQGRYFLWVFVPPVRIVMIGAVHISQALVPLARLVGFDPTVIDPRTAFATPERFADVPLIAEWPDDALPRLGLDRFTAIAVLTHDPKIDDPALAHALARDCFYIGALGSRKTHAARVERLTAAGFGPDQLRRIHAPIGLDIGAMSPAEIAVSIIAEITASLRLGADRPARVLGD